MNITTTRTKQPFIFWCGQMIDGLPVRGHFAGTWEEFVVFLHSNCRHSRKIWKSVIKAAFFGLFLKKWL